MQPQKSELEWAPMRAIGYWLNRASRMLLRLQDERLRPHGFSMGQIPVVGALMDGSVRSQKELAQLARVTQPTMAEMLARMERDGVVRRTADPDDGRGSLISLTEPALERLPTMREALMISESEAVAGLTEREVATLRALLQRVVSNLEGVEAATPEAPADERPRSRKSKTRREQG
jgi:MarR family transcriptional regulator, transcriptional regulator for hemolysin